jgi:AraC-like DNA-binding protein
VKSVVDSWREPLFADLLRGIRLRSCVYRPVQFRAPWGVSFADQGTVFHIVAAGRGVLQLNGEPKPTRFSGGDLVVVTRGAHTLRDAPTTPAVDFFDLIEGRGAGKDGVIRIGARGPIARFVCGGVQFENGAANPLLAVLPPVLHVKASEKGKPEWLRPIVDQVLAEVDGASAGSAEVVTRLTDVLLIQAVRWYFQENVESAEFGWLAAVRDQQIGRALALLHAHPAERWTIASLAHGVALSRSAFASKFTELIGEPPLHYLTRLRIDAAARQLRSSDEKLSAIADAVGYESVTAFTRTFRRLMGMTPGQVRESRWADGSTQAK